MEKRLNLENLKAWTPVLLVAGVFIFLYWPALNEFVYDWSHDDNYSHGFLIPVISGYLLWQKKEAILQAEYGRNGLGLAVVIVGLLLNILGTAAAEWFTVRFSMILVLLGLVWYLAGSQVLRLTWFPIAFLVFAIPIPYTIFRTLTFPLQLFSTKVTHEIITAAGIPALRQGNILHLQNYSLEVVEACSGLRSIITLSALSAVFAYMSPGGPVQRSTLFVMAVPIAIVANIFRLLVTTFGALLISSSFAEGFLHEFSGLLVFMVGLTLLFISGAVIKWIGTRKNTG